MKDDREELEARIAALLDGQLSPAEAAHLEVFLANTDQDLSARVIAMLADKGAVQSLPKPKAPEELSGRIMEAVERASLMHGVEHLAHPQRSWWQSHGAVAAGLILVLGGFSYFIAQSLYRPDNPWQRFVDTSGDKSSSHGVTGALAMHKDTDVKAPADQIASLDMAKRLDEAALRKAGTFGKAAGDTEVAGAAGAGGQQFKGGGDLAAAPSEALIAAQLAQAQETVNESFDAALKKGFVGAESPQAALSAVKADPRQFSSGPPVVLALVAHDAADPQRLRMLLETFMTEDATLSSQQIALFDRVNSTNNNFDNPRNSTNANGSLSLTDPDSNAKGGPNLGVIGAAQGTPAPATQIAINNNNDVNNYNNNYKQNGNTLQDRQFAGNNTTGTQYNVYDARRRGFDNNGNLTLNGTSNLATKDAGSFGTNQSANQSAQYQSANQGRANNQRGTYSGPAPYRLMLRPSQLNQVADAFQVHTVVRGTNSYVINDRNDPRHQEQVASAKLETARDLTLERRMGSAAPGAIKAIPAPAAPAAPAPTLSEHASEAGSAAGPRPTSSPAALSERVASELKTGNRESLKPDALKIRAAEERPIAPTKEGSESERLKASQQQRLEVGQKFPQASPKADDQWIECIITMEPAAPDGSQLQLDSNQRNGK